MFKIAPKDEKKKSTLGESSLHKAISLGIRVFQIIFTECKYTKQRGGLVFVSRYIKRDTI